MIPKAGKLSGLNEIPLGHEYFIGSGKDQT